MVERTKRASRSTSMTRWLSFAALAVVGCGGPVSGAPDALRITELMARNGGAAIDEVGEADDWVEVLNVAGGSVTLSGYAMSDGARDPVPLPDITLRAGERTILWLDDDVEQGEPHLPFKLSGDGELVRLETLAGDLVDEVEFPELAENESFARFPESTGEFSKCRYSSPGRPNGEACVPNAPIGLPESAEFRAFEWPDPEPLPPLTISEVNFAMGFVELTNNSSAAVDPAMYSLRITRDWGDAQWPAALEGEAVRIDDTPLMPGESRAFEIPPEATPVEAMLESDGAVLSLFLGEDPVQRVEVLAPPPGASLVQLGPGPMVYCAPTPSAANEGCAPVASRALPSRARALRTPGDFATLAEGGTQLGIQSVKFIIDMERGDRVHLLSAGAWDLHYTFTREVIDAEPHLDRCDREQSREHFNGWSAFSDREYDVVEGRRYLLGTLVRHSAADVYSVEFATGDAITGDLMRRAFFSIMQKVPNPQRWSIRPQGAAQLERARTVEGRAPIVDPNAPFRDLAYQPLTEAIGYGELRFVPVGELERASLGPTVIVVTDDVPNDIPFVGGLITEAFQTPLAHVNVLSKARGTPNLALPRAREVLQEHLGSLVKLAVTSAGYEVTSADPVEAQAYWDAQRPPAGTVAPRLDTSQTGIVELTGLGLEALPFVGAKAAQMAEMTQIESRRDGCRGAIPTPQDPFALPMAHYIEHFTASGAKAMIDALLADEALRGDPLRRRDALEAVRLAMTEHTIEPGLLADVNAHILSKFGMERRIRFRSSSNAEDLPEFNGAGLYTSGSASLEDEGSVELRIKQVWASLWNARAFDEREFARIDHTQVTMGVLVHPAFPSERANGVAVSRSLLDPIRSDEYYMNNQAGEALVTNPAPGVVTEELVYRWWRNPRVMYSSRSSLTAGRRVLTPSEVDQVMCVMRAVHDHFRTLLDPSFEARWFAMETEFKFMGETRDLVVKQARPYSFGRVEIPMDCREF